MSASTQRQSTLRDALDAVMRPRARVMLLVPARGGRPSHRHPPLVKPAHHAHYELAICFQGQMMLVGEENIHPLRAGDAVLVMPGAWHYESYRSARQPYEVCWFIAHPRRMNCVFTSYRRGRLQIVGHGGVPALGEKDLLDELARELRQQPLHWRVRARTLLAQLLVDLDRRLQGGPPPQAPEVDPVQKLARIVETRFREPLQIKSLASEAGLSPDHLSRRFKSAYGLTFKSYLNAIRIHHAKLLLKSGWSLKRTAHECGFSDVYYFGRVFKQECRTPPGKFARQQVRR